MTTPDTTTLTVVMPALGENVTEGTVTRWLRKPGDSIALDEPLLEVATDKVDTEIPSPAAGILTEIIAAEDDIVNIGAPLAHLTPAAVAPTGPETDPDSTPKVSGGAGPAGDTPNPSVPVSAPAADDRAASAEFLPPPTGSDQSDRVEKLPRIRRTIATRMVESLQTAAQLTTVLEVDVSAIAQLRREHKDSFLQRTGHKLSYLPFFTKAAVEALPDNPVVNSSLDPDVTTVTYHRACHLGMAVDSDKGLMVPVIRNAQNLTIAALAQSIAGAAERVRTGKIGADELSGGTFTITNTGSRGALFDTPIINQPQSAILGTGAVVERLVPKYVEDQLTITVVPMVYLSISYLSLIHI